MDITGVDPDNKYTARNLVRVRETTKEHGKYATLSHMWGQQQRPLQLLRDNLSKLQNGMPWMQLPRTFRDAVMFSRKLGIGYIWIDSLCIIQDDAEDWRRQSGKMASIYENSYVTLAASVSENSSFGCFRTPDHFLIGYIMSNRGSNPSVDEHDRIGAMLKSDEEGPLIFVRGSPRHRYASRMEDNPLPLLERGWVYQERLLSPRVLFFGDIDLMFECNQSMGCYCKTWTHSYSRNVRSHPVKSQHASSLGLGQPDTLKLKPSQLAPRWNRVVEEYSALQLTFMKDRLPAIAGVAKQFARYLPNSTYASGMWSETLIEGLSWAAILYPPLKRKSEAKDSPCPSWSWMAPMTRIAFPPGWFLPEAEVNATIVGTNFQQDEIDPFMDVTLGSITLHGFLCEVRARKIHTTSSYNPIRRGVSMLGRPGFCSSLALDHGDEAFEWRRIRPRWFQKLYQGEPSLETSLQRLALDDEEDVDEEQPIILSHDKITHVEQIPQRFWCFSLARYIDDGGRTDTYLLLERVDCAQQLYKRVGYISTSVQGSIFEDVSKHVKQTVTIV